MSDRNIDDLSPEMKPKCIRWQFEMGQLGIDVLITCTLRTQAEQEALYAQGRTAPGPIVTWTLNSKHLTGDAFDFVIMVNGKPDWRMSHKDLWAKAVEVGESLGLSQVVSSNGRIMEYGHLQVAS